MITCFSLKIKDSWIHGITTIPEYKNNYAIIFLHGWGGYRVGPHDMFVKFAQAFSQMGYYCLRFDFRGKGYSGKREDNTTKETMREDLDKVMIYCRENLNVKKIILLGICSGAKLALYYATCSSFTIQSIIALSSAPLNPMADNNILALQHMRANIIMYSKKLLSKNFYTKLLYKEINFKSAYKNIFINSFNILKPKRRTPIKRKSLSTFNVAIPEILIIQGEADPEAKVTSRQISIFLKKHEIEPVVYYISKANHSFYSQEWENKIMTIIINWLEKCFGKLEIY